MALLADNTIFLHDDFCLVSYLFLQKSYLVSQLLYFRHQPSLFIISSISFFINLLFFVLLMPIFNQKEVVLSLKFLYLFFQLMALLIFFELDACDCLIIFFQQIKEFHICAYLILQVCIFDFFEPFAFFVGLSRIPLSNLHDLSMIFFF